MEGLHGRDPRTTHRDDAEKGHSVVDATTGYLISAPRESRELGKFRRWLHERRKGDFGYDDAHGGKLFGVRGAKLVLLEVENWPQADAVTDKALRALLKNQGTETISLKEDYEAHRDQHKTYPAEPRDDDEGVRNGEKVPDMELGLDRSTRFRD